MASLVHFETPENVQIAYRPSGLGTRFCAWVLDSFFVTVVSIVLVIVGGVVAAAAGVSSKQLDRALGPGQTQSPDFGLYVIAFMLLAWELGSLFYFTLSELFWRGQTIGKRACDVRVVKADGFALDAVSILVRNILRLIDQVPVLWIVPLLSKRGQRFGDMLAGTIVVSETQDRVGELRARLLARESAEGRFRFDASMLNRLTPVDVEAVERILERWPELSPNQRTQLLDRVIEPLSNRLAAASPDPADRHEFLVELLTAVYRRESRRLG